MRRFHFRLRRLLNLKAYAEQEWEIKLGQATSECLEVENKIDEALRNKAAVFYGAHPSKREVDVNALAMAHLYMDRLTGTVELLEDDLVAKEAARRKVQEGYLEASKERKVLEKLKDRREAEFYQEERNEAMKELDDISNSNYLKRSREDG